MRSGSPTRELFLRVESSKEIYRVELPREHIAVGLRRYSISNGGIVFSRSRGVAGATASASRGVWLLSEFIDTP